MNKENPRWIHEIPSIQQIGKKRKLTKEERKEAKEFEDAVKSGDIRKWFNKNI